MLFLGLNQYHFINTEYLAKTLMCMYNSSSKLLIRTYVSNKKNIEGLIKKCLLKRPKLFTKEIIVTVIICMYSYFFPQWPWKTFDLQICVRKKIQFKYSIGSNHATGHDCGPGLKKSHPTFFFQPFYAYPVSPRPRRYKSYLNNLCVFVS